MAIKGKVMQYHLEEILNRTVQLMNGELTQYGLDKDGRGTDEYEHAREAHIAARRALIALDFHEMTYHNEEGDTS